MLGGLGTYQCTAQLFRRSFILPACADDDLIWPDESFPIFRLRMRHETEAPQKLLRRALADEAAYFRSAIENPPQDAAGFEFDYRVVLPDG